MSKWLVATMAAQHGGGRPAVSTLLDAFDGNGDGALEASEVPAAVWSCLSQADANGDGSVSETEFDSYRGGAKSVGS